MGTGKPEVGNKLKRAEMAFKDKTSKKKEKKERQIERRKEAEALGSEAPPKQLPKSLDTMREYDETVVAPGDDEVMGEDAMDEFAEHFAGTNAENKTLITTGRYTCPEIMNLVNELLDLMPHAEYRKRGNSELKPIIEGATERGYTMMMVITSKSKKATGLWVVKLPVGPTAHFRMTSVRLRKQIRNHGRPTSHRPELVLNNFSTRLGHRVGRLFGSLFPHDPQFHGRRVVTLHNQRDFIFLRHHRYMFSETGERAYLQELGPRITLRLKSLQLGTFDTTNGLYEWHHKPDMDTSRRRFFL
ncbi:anticodon-binding protein [Pavlovales sp. CCMP2436]|nr:anticodon-binding protein [Pavlovales sp. CCMP2436]